MLVKLKPRMIKRGRGYYPGAYRWAEKTDIKVLIRVLNTLEHVFSLCEARLTNNETEYYWTSLVHLRRAICESDKGRELLLAEEGKDA